MTDLPLCLCCSLLVMIYHLEGLDKVGLVGTMGSILSMHLAMKKQFWREASILSLTQGIHHGIITNWSF